MITIDLDLGTQLNRALRASGYRALQSVRCDVEECDIVLSGVVPSYFLKQMAQTILLRHRGMRRIRNLLLVKPPSAQPYTESNVARI